MSIYDRRIVGFRTWRFHDEPLGLRSFTHSTYWPPGKELTAECKCGAWMIRPGPKVRHKAPGRHKEQSSDCGIHAMYARDNTVLAHMQSPRQAMGIIVAHGVKEYHTLGFRAEFAQPIALYEHLDDRDPQWTKVMRKVANMYGLPILNKDYIEDFAAEYGDLIMPEDLEA